MKRVLLNLLSLVASLPFALLVLLWLRSYHTGDHVTKMVVTADGADERQVSYEATSERGRLLVYVESQDVGIEFQAEPGDPPWMAMRSDLVWDEYRASWSPRAQHPNRLRHAPRGVSFFSGGIAISKSSVVEVLVPYWLLALVTSPAPAWLLLRVRRGLRRRLRSRLGRLGICADCGYDLRASRGRCPECGATRDKVGGGIRGSLTT
jgi:hypothetical protein